MSSEEVAAHAQGLRDQARIARAALAQHGPEWADYDRILEIVIEIETEAAEMDRVEDA